jgi:hypothetical protein
MQFGLRRNGIFARNSVQPFNLKRYDGARHVSHAAWRVFTSPYLLFPMAFKNIHDSMSGDVSVSTAAQLPVV